LKLRVFDDRPSNVIYLATFVVPHWIMQEKYTSRSGFLGRNIEPPTVWLLPNGMELGLHKHPRELPK
jgi:hypothetical protein